MAFVDEIMRIASQDPKPVMIPIPESKAWTVAEHIRTVSGTDYPTEFFFKELKRGRMFVKDIPLRVRGTISNWN
jgi:hypothetical protein